MEMKDRELTPAARLPYNACTALPVGFLLNGLHSISPVAAIFAPIRSNRSCERLRTNRTPRLWFS